MGRGGTAASRRHALLLMERRRACRGRARLACGWRPRGPAEWASLPEYTREIHGGISCVHGASRPRTGKRLSRRVEHVRASMEDRHEVEVVLSHLPLDPVERRQRVVGSVHSVMLRSEMHQGAPLLRGRGAASLHASIAAARVATRPSCSAAACSHRPDATRGPLGQGSACRAFERCGGATVGSRSPTPTALEKLRCVFSVTRKHPWRTPRGLIRHTLQAEIAG